MASLKSAAIIGLLVCVLGSTRSLAESRQWLGWPTQGQPDQTVEEARRAEEQARAAQAGWLAMQDWQAQQDQRAGQQEQPAQEEDRPKFLEWTTPPDLSPEQKEAQRQAALLAAERNYKEMNEAAMELADLSQRISNEINGHDQQVVSKRMLKDLDKLEKLAKKVRDRGRRLPKNLVKP